jgi:drug/metabolite transporter (DMT)-like permease
VIAAVLLAPLTVLGSRPRAPVRSVATAAAAGLALAIAGLLEFEALSRLPALALVTVVFLAPIWIALATWARFGQRPTRSAAAALVVVLAGMTLLVQAPGEWTLDRVGLGLAVAASILFAVVFLLLEDLVASGPSAAAVARVVAVAAVVPAVVEHEGLAAELTRSRTIGYAVGIGALTAGSLLLLAVGMQSTPAFAASVITAAEPVAAALLSAVLLGEVLTIAQMLGAFGVVAGAIGVATGSADAH